MAILLGWNGLSSEIHPKSPAHGFTREELSKLIGCEAVEIHTLADGRLLVVDEIARLRRPQLPVNIKATQLFQAGRSRTGWAIFGNVVIADVGEVQ